MRRTKVVLEETSTERPKTRAKPAMTPEGRENQCIALAYDLAEKRLRAGTATSQEVCHFLRMGSPNAKLEQENLRLKKEKMEAEIKIMETQQRMEDLYANAIAAIKSYRGYEDE